MSEELILMARKSFRKCVNKIIEKNGGHIKDIYSFVCTLFSCCFF